MSRDWKPGDVAIVDGPGTRLPITFFKNEDTSELMFNNGSGFQHPVRHLASSARPLVVIDPEDREQVERLAATFMDERCVGQRTLVEGGTTDAMQAALRSLIEPPKPPEPADPKARVTDRRENIWRLLADGDWVCTSGPDVGEYLVWWQLAERGPLSIEGVMADV